MDYGLSYDRTDYTSSMDSNNVPYDSEYEKKINNEKFLKEKEKENMSKLKPIKSR